MTRLSGECDRLTGEFLREVLQARAEADRGGPGDDRTGPRRAMDALVALAHAHAAAQTDATPGEPRLVVVTSVDDLASCTDVRPDRVTPDDALTDVFAGVGLDGPDDDARDVGGSAAAEAAGGRLRRPSWSSCSRGGVPVGPRTLAALACSSVLTQLVLSPLRDPLDSSPDARQLGRRARRALEHRAGYRCERYGCGCPSRGLRRRLHRVRRPAQHPAGPADGARPGEGG